MVFFPSQKGHQEMCVDFEVPSEETHPSQGRRFKVLVVWAATVVRLLWEAVQGPWRGRLDWYFAILLIIVDVRRVWESTDSQNQQ